MFDSRYTGNGGRPDIAWLTGEIASGEDVEFFVNNDAGTFCHALTLTGMSCDPDENCFITNADPNDPTTMFNRALTIGMGGRLEFSDPFGLTGTVFVDAAFSESAVPAPATAVLLLAGLGGPLVRLGRGQSRQGLDKVALNR